MLTLSVILTLLALWTHTIRNTVRLASICVGRQTVTVAVIICRAETEAAQPVIYVRVLYALTVVASVWVVTLSPAVN